MPRRMVIPVYPSHTAEEWLNIMAAQKQRPEQFLDFKRGTKPQPGDAYPLIMCQAANGSVYRPMLARLFRLPRSGKIEFQSFDRRVAELTEVSLGFTVPPRKSWKSDVLLSAQ